MATMKVAEVKSVSGKPLFEVQDAFDGQTLSEPHVCRRNAVQYMGYLNTVKGTDKDPLRDYWLRVETRVTAALYECEEGSDDPRAIQGGGGASERLYKIIRGTRHRIAAYVKAYANRYGDELLVRYRP